MKKFVQLLKGNIIEFENEKLMESNDIIGDLTIMDLVISKKC